MVKESKPEHCCLLFEITSFLASSPEGLNLFSLGHSFIFKRGIKSHR